MDILLHLKNNFSTSLSDHLVSLRYVVCLVHCVVHIGMTLLYFGVVFNEILFQIFHFAVENNYNPAVTVMLVETGHTIVAIE